MAPKGVDGRRNCLLNNAEEERREAESTMMNVDVQKESSVLDCGLWRKRGRDISNEESI